MGYIVLLISIPIDAPSLTWLNAVEVKSLDSWFSLGLMSVVLQ